MDNMSDNNEFTFTHEELRKRIENDLTSLQKTDHVKSVITPAKLADVIVGKIPMSIIPDDAKTFLVMSDTGLLLALYERVLKYQADTHRITFLAHTKDVADYVRECFDVNVELIKYSKLNDFFSRKLNLSGSMCYNDGKEMKFDVVVGNPPYQPETPNGENTGAVKIWHKFVEKAFDITQSNGHILFCTPDNWKLGGGKRAVYKKAQKLMFDNGIKWYMNCQTMTQNYFPMVKSSALIGAWYVQKSEIQRQKSMLEKLNIYVDKQYCSILERYFHTYETSNSIELVNGKQIGEIEGSACGDEQHPYKYAHTTAQVKNGLFHWHTEKDYAYDLKKVFVSWSGQFVLGYNAGGCGIGRCMQAYIVQDEKSGKRLETFLRTPVIDVVLKAMTGHTRETFPAQLFPVIFYQKLPTQILELEWEGNSWKESAKQVFGFTDEEIDVICKMN